MKYSFKDYARAFTLAAHDHKSHDKIVKNLVALVKKNGDGAALPKILEAAERMIREKEGLSKITIETARPISEKLKKGLATGDIVEEKIVPELIAGVRVTLNDELQFDATLARKLQKMLG